MTTGSTAARPDETLLLDLFCAEGRDGAWRVYVRPTWLPRSLHRCFDRHGEAYPVFLDFEELDRRMQKAGLAYEKRESRARGVELMARGRAATILANWLGAAFASGKHSDE